MEIRSTPSTQQYRENYERLFGKERLTVENEADPSDEQKIVSLTLKKSL